MRRGERRGCLGPLLLMAFGAGLGLVLGVVLPNGGRAWIAGRLPARLGQMAQTPPPPSVSVAQPPTPSLAVVTPPPLPVGTPPPLETARSLPDQLVIPAKSREVARLYNGLQVVTTLETEAGRPASLERETFSSYALDLRLLVKVPTPMRTLAELSQHSPTLGTALPKLPSLLEKAEVSKFFFAFYKNKTDLLRQNLTRLDALLPRDVFYDADTILELQDPDTQRKVLLIQTDMDVDTDGSDPERWNDIDASDPSFQPLTNYKWPKRAPTVVSPLVKVYNDRLEKLEVEARAPNPRRGIAASMTKLHEDLDAVERYSSLIARNDPYIVLPSFMVRPNGGPYQPQVGDYAVVLAGNKLYPAIFGDKGPNHQLGEASLRLAQAVDPRASALHSPVDDLKITYLVFPGTAETPFGPPDLDKLRARCQTLLNEIGGNKAELHAWVSLLPTPTPSPTPIPTPTPTLSPGVSPGPSPSAASPGVSPTDSPAPPPPGASTSPKATPSPGPSALPSHSPAHKH